MALTDKLGKSIRRATLGAAIMTAPFAQGQSHSDSYTESQSPSITQTIQKDYFNLYQELKSDRDEGIPGAKEAYTDYIIQHYQDIKKQLDTKADFMEKRLETTGIYDSRYERAINDRIVFNQDIQEQYQVLTIKQENGQTTESDEKLLFAISGEAQKKLDQLMHKVDTYPQNNPNVHRPFYQMMQSMINQLDYQQKECNIHPETRLIVAEKFMNYAQMLSQKTDVVEIIPGYNINPNKLHTFLDRTGTKIDASNGLSIQLNHPDKSQNTGFELSIKQEDMTIASRAAQVAYTYVKENVNNYDVRDKLLRLMNDIAAQPTLDTLSSVKADLKMMAEEYQEIFQDPVFKSCIKQATEIPFQLNIRDKKGVRPATKADADTFLEMAVANIRALDKEGVINLNDIISQAVGKDSKTLRGLTSVGFFFYDTFSDPVRSYLKEPVTNGFVKMVELRDEWNQPSNHTLLTQNATPIQPISASLDKTNGAKETPKYTLNIPAFVAKKGRS